MAKNSLPKLIGSVLLCEAAGGVGTIFSRNSLREWYPDLEKPSFNPPDWLFGPVWTLLYALMGLSLYLLNRSGTDDSSAVTNARFLFGVQLVLNVLWSYVFFGRRSVGWALVEIEFLWAAIVATALAFSRVSKIAALLLVPYLLWTGFATLLNYEIWRLNR